MRSQLGDGTFFGVRREGRLVAAGGTHLYSAAESVGAVGNVYTHRAYRGQGHASAVTSAIVRRLIERDTRHDRAQREEREPRGHPGLRAAGLPFPCPLLGRARDRTMSIPMTFTFQQYIDGAWTGAAAGGTWDVINPATEEVGAHRALRRARGLPRGHRGGGPRVPRVVATHALRARRRSCRRPPHACASWPTTWRGPRCSSAASRSRRRAASGW